MMNVPVEGVNAKVEMNDGTILKDDVSFLVLEAKVNKGVILNDRDKDLVMQEKQVVSVESVNGEFIKVGSMEEVNTNGNWPKVYGGN